MIWSQSLKSVERERKKNAKIKRYNNEKSSNVESGFIDKQIALITANTYINTHGV